MKHEKSFPNFLGIGAHRAGTTWLWSALRTHPGIWLPPRKELHYFDRSPTYPSPSLLASPSLISRVFGIRRHHTEWRKLLVRCVLANVRRPDRRQILWDMRYVFGRYTDDWYASLFKDGDGLVKGEITPAYSVLCESDVAHIRHLMPELQVLFLLRNPVDRAWSQIRATGVQHLPVDRLKQFVNRPSVELRSDYIRTIGIWGAHFPMRQLFIGFFDEIERNPGGLVSAICRFLGVDPCAVDPRIVGLRVHAAAPKEIPFELEVYLAEKYHHMVKQLSDMFGGHATSWLRSIEATIARARSVREAAN